jgi:hypothetical protein
MTPSVPGRDSNPHAWLTPKPGNWNFCQNHFSDNPTHQELPVKRAPYAHWNSASSAYVSSVA